MKTIFKYAIISHQFSLHLPRGAVVRHFAMQNGQQCLWVEQDTDKPKVEREFLIFGTGHDIPESPNEAMVYFGTLFEEPYVWHLYERISLTLS